MFRIYHEIIAPFSVILICSDAIHTFARRCREFGASPKIAIYAKQRIAGGFLHMYSSLIQMLQLNPLFAIINRL